MFRNAFFVAVALLGAVACSSNPACMIKGTVEPQTDSLWLVDMAGNRLDACDVQDGSFTLSCERDPQKGVAVLTSLGGAPVSLIPDSKEISVTVENGKAVVDLPTGYSAVFDTVAPENLAPQKVKLSARPEELIVQKHGGEGLSAVVDDCVFLGLNTHYFVHLTSGEKAEIIQESTIDSIIEPGTEVRLRLNTEKANLFSEDGERNLLTGVENDLASGK